MKCASGWALLSSSCRRKAAGTFAVRLVSNQARGTDMAMMRDRKAQINMTPMIDILLVLIIQGITLGATAGAGGRPLTGCPLVYASASPGAYRLALGRAAGDFVVVANYFDKNGASPAVVLATARGRISDNHFLADSTCSGPLITLSTANQNLTFRGNDCRGNGSSMTALLQLIAGAGGAPTNGVYDGNNVYGTHPALIAPLIDRNGVAIPATSTATTYVAGNVAGA